MKVSLKKKIRDYYSRVKTLILIYISGPKRHYGLEEGSLNIKQELLFYDVSLCRGLKATA